MLSSVPLCQIACGAQHVAFLTAFGQVYTFGGFFSFLFFSFLFFSFLFFSFLFFSFLFFSFLFFTLLFFFSFLFSFFSFPFSYPHLPLGNDVSQCGLGEDSLPFVEEPTLVTTLVQVCAFSSPLPFHFISFYLVILFLTKIVESHIHHMRSQSNSSHCLFVYPFFPFPFPSLPPPFPLPFSFHLPFPSSFHLPSLSLFVADDEFYLWGADTANEKRIAIPQEFQQWNKIGEDKALQQIYFGPQHVNLLVKSFENEVRKKKKLNYFIYWSLCDFFLSENGSLVLGDIR